MAFGCGARRVPCHPVKGQVTFRDRPAAGALVIFHPVDGSAPPAIPAKPSGRVGDDGSFTLSTYGEGDGAPAGQYRITVQWSSGEESRKPDDTNTTGELAPPLPAHQDPKRTPIPP